MQVSSSSPHVRKSEARSSESDLKDETEKTAAPSSCKIREVVVLDKNALSYSIRFDTVRPSV